MDNRKEIDDTSKEINGAVSPADEVDNILGEILGSDGAYKSDFGDMFSKYNVDASLDLDDIIASTGFHRRDYAADAEAASRDIADRMAQRAAANIKITYDRQTEVPRNAQYTREAQYAREPEGSNRPEFTPDGTVLYPVYGVGESEQRVVFDADWEAQAKEEAARLEKMRRSNMLRGDSAYARQFRFSGAEGRVMPKTTPDPSLIDPIDDALDPGTREIYSADAEREAENNGGGNEKTAKEEKKSFFQEGFSADQKNDEAVGGETEQNGGSEMPSPVKGDLKKEDAKQLVQQKLRGQMQRIAGIEENINSSHISNSFYADDEFEEIDTDAQRKPAYSAETAFAYSPDSLFNSAPDLVPDAEKLTSDDVKRLNESAMNADSKIAKSAGEKFRFFIKTHFSKEGLRRFAANNLPQKSDSTGEKIRKIVRAVSFVALVCALIYLLIYYHNYRARINFIRDNEHDLSELENIPDYELDDAWAEMRAKYPDVDFPEGMNIKFANLYAISRDVVGWLKIENTDISTVLLQTNNDSYYLYRDIYGSYSRYGNPYVKSSCNMGREGLSKNTVIYGHNTHDKLIFNKLENYMTADGYLKAPIITLDTLYETTKWKIFAVMLTNAEPEDDNGNVFTYLYSSFSSDDAFMKKMEEIKARSMIHTGVDVQPGDKTLMLYTCYRNIFSSGRLVIVARQLREGESEDVNSSLVYYDSSAIFPQAYYDKKGGGAGTTAKAPENTAAPTEPEETSSKEQPTSENEDPSKAGEAEIILPTEGDVPESGAAEKNEASENVSNSEEAAL